MKLENENLEVDVEMVDEEVQSQDNGDVKIEMVDDNTSSGGDDLAVEMVDEDKSVYSKGGEGGPGDEKKKELSPRAKEFKSSKIAMTTPTIGGSYYKSLSSKQKDGIWAEYLDQLNNSDNPFVASGKTADEMAENYYQNKYKEDLELNNRPLEKYKKNEVLNNNTTNFNTFKELIGDPRASEEPFFNKEVNELDDNDFEALAEFEKVVNAEIAETNKALAIEKEKKENEEFLTLLTDISKIGDTEHFEARNKVMVRQDISKKQFEKVKKRAETNNIDLDEAARLLGYQVNVDAKLDEDEDGFITGRYSIQTGDTNPLRILNNNSAVEQFLDWNYSKNNLQKMLPGFSYTDFGAEFLERTRLAKGSWTGWDTPDEKINWMNRNMESIREEVNSENYQNFIDYLNASPKYGPQIYNYINTAGDNILQNEQAEQVINYLNGGIPEQAIAGTVAWDKIEEVKKFVWGNPEMGTSEGGNSGRLQTIQKWIADHSDGEGGFAFKGHNISNEEIDDFLGWNPPGTINGNKFGFYSKASWGLNHEILRDPEKLKAWYAAELEKTTRFDFDKEKFNYLYDKRSGKVLRGDDAYIITRKAQLLKSGAAEEDIIEISSQEEYEAKMKEIRTNLLNFYPEKRGDLSGIIVQSYYNIIGLQEDLIKTGIIDDFNYSFFSGSSEDRDEFYNTAKANVVQGKLTSYPRQLDITLKTKNKFLVEKYNEEVAKFDILSKAYVYNFNPSSIEKQGFWDAAFETVKEGALGEVSNELFGTSTSYINSDEARQNFYNTYVATDPKLKKVFSKKDVDELYDKTFLAKAGGSLPDFLVIMAEFAITRKLAGRSLKALGQMTELFLGGSKIAKAAPFVGAFVEELAAISLVNATFNEDMSLLFAVTGPVGKMIDDFYKAFLNPKATGMYAKVGKVIKAQPQAVRIAEDGILKLGTSAVVMKIGEVPEAIIHSVQKGEVSPLAHIFDPEEFGVLMLQLAAVKGIAPIKGVVDIIHTGAKEIRAYTENKKYKEYISKYEKLIFKEGYSSSAKNKKSRIAEIETAAAKKLKELGVESRLINTLAKGGLSFKQVKESKSIEDILSKIEKNVDGTTYKKIKEALEAGQKFHGNNFLNKIKKASEIVDAKNGLKLNAEYDAFLKSVENEANTTDMVKDFAEKAVSAETAGTKKPLVLDVNTIKAIKRLNSPTLIAKVLDSYGVKPNSKTGKYKDPMLNFLLEKGKQVEVDGVMTDTYPNLSYINMAFEKASKENVNLETPTGKAYVENIIQEINLSRTEARIKAEMAADPGINKESFEKDLESIKEQKESLMRSRQGIVDKAQSENVTSELNLIEKVKTEKEELGIDDIITVDNQLQLQKFVQTEVNKIDKQLSKLDKEIKRTTDPNKKKELEAKKDGLLKDKSQFEAELTEYSKDAKSEAADGMEMLNKGKAIETSDGRKVVVFNIDAIFKSGGAGVTAHELLHPFVNQKLRELGLANNSVKQKRFIQNFTRGLNDNAISSIERRLVKMGIFKEGNKLLNEDGTFSLEFENLNGKERLEIFNAYAEGIVLGEIGWESGSKEFKQATEAFEAFLETEAGSEGTARDMTVTEDAFRIYINEYVKQIESFRGKENLTDRERLAVMISKEETLKEGELSPWVFQSSKEASGAKSVKLEENIRIWEDKIKNVKKGEEHLIDGWKRNIAVCKKLVAKSNSLNEAFLTIENAISEGGFKDYTEMKSNEKAALSVREAEGRITLLANSPPNGPLFKLKKEFDPTKVDSKYSTGDVEFFREEWNAQADVYFSMAIRRYVDTRRKVMEETGNAYPTPFEAYMVNFIKKKGNLIEKTQDLEFNKRFEEASLNGEIIATDTKLATSHLKSPGEVNLHVEKAQEYESPFKFGDEVKNQTSKTILSLGTVEAKNEKAFNKEIDNTIRIFMTDAVFKSSFFAKNKSGNMSFDLKTAENNLKANYDFVSRYIEGNSAWLRLRNFDLFYQAQLTDGGNVVRKGKAEEPVYITEMPKLEDYIDFFLAQGEFAPKGNQKASNIRSQRLKKLAELYSRIEVGNEMANVMQNGGNVVVDGKTVMPAITDSRGLANFIRNQDSSFKTPVDEIAVDNIIQSSKEVRNSFVKTINNKNFLNEVKIELIENFKITPTDLTNYNNARIGNQEIIELTNGREITVDEVSEIINIATSNVVKSKIKDGGKGGSMITKSIETSNQSSPKKVKDFTVDEAKERKEVALKAMEINNYAGITREQANKNKESDATNFYDPRTKKFDVEKYYEYIDNLKIISEYGLSIDAVGGTTSVAKMLGDHIRINASGKLITDVTFDGTNVDAFEGVVDPSTGRVLNVYEAIMFRHPNHVPGSKNVHLGKIDLSKITSTSDMATLNTFLKIDPKELEVDHLRLDEDSGEMVVDEFNNKLSTKIKNLLKKLDIDYNDPNAKQQVLDIVLNNKHNITRTRAMRAKMLGVYEMFWSKEISNEQLGDIFSTWVKAEFKGNSNNKYGSRLLASNSAAEVNNMKLADVREKVEHGYDIAGLMRDIVPDIVNGNKKAMLEKLDKYEMYHFDRNKLDKMDDTPGIGTNPVVEGMDPSPKILYDPTNAGITYIKVDGKNVKVSDYVNDIVTTTLQSSKEKKKVGKVETELIKNRVTEIILKDGKVKQNEVQQAIEQAKKEIGEKIEINNENQKNAETDKNIKVEAGKSEVVKNAATPENNISNAQLIDQGNKTNWNEDVVIETPNGEIKYDASNNTVTSPNNTGKFSPKKKVVLLAGGAGSGKGTTWKNIVKDHPELAELEIINSDTDKQRLKKTFELGPNEKGYNTEERSLLSQITGLSVKEAKLRREELIAEGNGFVLDGTLASYRSNSKLIKQLKDKGYDVQIVYTKTNVEVASKRNANRKERSIKDGLLRRNHDQVNETIELFKKDGETIIEINGEKAYIKGDGDVSFNTLNSTVKSEVKPDTKTNALLEENGVQSSKEYYEKESDRIISERYDLEKGPIDPAVADKASKERKKRFKLMGFKAQQALNLYLEVVGKGDTKALEYVEGGVDLATKGRLDFGRYSVNARQSIKQITKGDKELKLNEKSGIKGGWTRSEAIRMFMFYRGSKTKSINDLAKDLGVKVETLTEAYEYVKNDQKLLDYANNLVKSVNVDGKGWVEPYEGWARGSLKYDIHKAIDSRRAHFMSQFNEWHTITFSKKNMDKIKAGMNEKDFENWKLSVEDFHDRAITGRTRATGERIGQKWVNWLHGSTAIALFGNRKSMMTQLISTTNFFGAKNNGVIEAGLAYGDPKIFDMMKYILNSKYLKDRRGSYDLALKELNELQNKYGDMYKKGLNLSFLLSQLGDNAAIVVGGSSMLLNNYKALKKANPEMTEERAMELAMEEVAMHSERTQQSTFAENLTYQQTKAIGKVTLNFLNTQIRYNNIALEEMKKIKKGVSKDITKSVARIINYTGLQVGAFAFLSSGMQYLLMDDEANYEDGKYDELVQNKKSKIMMDGMTNIIKGTGISGQAIVTMIGMCDAVIESATADDYRKQQAQIAKKALQFSPALSIKYSKLESASYKIREAIKAYKEGTGWRSPALEAGTKVFSAATNIAAPEYVFSLMDQYQFIMDERYSYWQHFGVAMGWTPYSMDPDFYKNKKLKNKPPSNVKNITIGGEGNDQYVPENNKKNKDIIIGG